MQQTFITTDEIFLNRIMTSIKSVSQFFPLHEFPCNKTSFTGIDEKIESKIKNCPILNEIKSFSWIHLAFKKSDSFSRKFS